MGGIVLCCYAVLVFLAFARMTNQRWINRMRIILSALFFWSAVCALATVPIGRDSDSDVRWVPTMMLLVGWLLAVCIPCSFVLFWDYYFIPKLAEEAIREDEYEADDNLS